jgi:hypothetical protein
MSPRSIKRLLAALLLCTSLVAPAHADVWTAPSRTRRDSERRGPYRR